MTATTTLGDFATFLNNSIGINADPAFPGPPGVTVDAGGSLVVTGDPGEDNALDIAISNIRSTNATFVNPLTFTQTQAANGESLFTTFQAFDSLGTPVQVNLTMVLDSKSNSGTTWRYYLESPDDTDATPVLGNTGTVSFDNNGRLLTTANDTFNLNRATTGAVDPLQIKLDFSGVTALTTDSSSLVMTNQDGFATGTLNSFSVGTDGVITGTFSNGLTRTLGQVATATFTNPEGLIGTTNNLYLVGANSGQAIIGSPGVNGAGTLVGGALELSNVDITKEFIGLISASTALFRQRPGHHHLQ